MLYFLSFLFYTTTADVPLENTIGYPHGACDAMSNAVNIFLLFLYLLVCKQNYTNKLQMHLK